MKFQLFDTWEELMGAVQDATRLADEKVMQFQKQELRPGTCFVRPTDFGFPVFGEILEFPNDYPEHDRKNWHYVFTRSYSEACRKGELGDQHISTMLPIPQQLLEACKATEFHPLIAQAVFAWALEKYRDKIIVQGGAE